MQSVKYHTIPNDNQFKVKDSIEPQLIEVHSAHDVPTSKKRHRSGWRGGMLCGVAAASSVLILSLASIVWISRQHEISPGIHVLYQGSCSRSSDINTVVHLVMNVMSTLLLGASNYAMTVLSSPTRAEIDIWHSRKIPLEIGINSIRNISKISYQRRILWFMLMAASVPLHLMFVTLMERFLDSDSVAVSTRLYIRLHRRTHIPQHWPLMNFWMDVTGQQMA